MKKSLPAIVILFLLISFNSLFAQAPAISYSGPHAYYAGTAITPIAPTSSGVAAPGYGNTPVSISGFTSPECVAVDGAGNVYVGLSDNDTTLMVFKVPAGGGAPITLATFFASHSSTIAIAADQAGNVYVTVEAGTNGGVYKIPAGGGSPASIGNVVGLPTGIAVDGAGNVYVVDQVNHFVSEILADGGATIRLPSETATANPISIAADVAGNVYIGDSFGSNNSNGVYEIPAGGGAAVAIITGSDIEPEAIATDGAGNVYVVDNTAYKVPTGGGSPITIASGIDFLNGIAVDGAGNVYVSVSNQGVIEYKPVGGYYISPGLPAGLSFNNATGIISGTPTAGSPATNYTITAYNNTGSSSAVLNLMVKPSIKYSSPKTYTAGTAITPLIPTSSAVAPYGYSGPVLYGDNAHFEPGIAVDAAGNVYVSVSEYSDTCSIIKMPAGGGPSVVLASGFAGGTSIAVDAAGNVYEANPGHNDQGDSFVTKIPAGGGVPVIIGSGFSEPDCIAVDAAGNVYVGDGGNKTLKEIPVNGGPYLTISTGYNYAGLLADAYGNIYFVDGDTSPGVFKIPAGGGAPVGIGAGTLGVNEGPYDPLGIAMDASGNLFVATNVFVYEFPGGGGAPIMLLNAAGSPVTNPGYGDSNSSSLEGIAVGVNGNLYITNLTTVVEMQPVGGYIINKPLPAGLMFDNTTGTISGKPTAASPATNYTVTAYGRSVGNTATVNLKVNLPALPTISYNGPQTYTQGTPIAALTPTSAGVAAPAYNSTPVTIASGFNMPQGIAADAAGNVYVADQSNNKVDKIPAGGGAPISIGTGFNRPGGVAVDGAGNVYVTDPNDGILYKIPAGGGSTVTVSSGFGDPMGVAVDGAGNIYVADANRNAIMKLPAGGGGAVSIGSGFNFPSNVAVDAAGNVYVADAGNKAIKKIPAAGGGAVATIATGFSSLFGIAVDASGNVFVGDVGNNAIKEVPAGGGAPIVISNAINGPAGIAVDGAGNIYEADGSDFFQVYTLKEFRPIGGYYISPFLPAGLSFNSKTGVISGNPTIGSPATIYTVTAYNRGGSVTTSLNINVTSTNASLTGLKTSNGTLSPAFAAGNYNYTTSVANAITSTTITPTAAYSASTITVNRVPVASGSASAAIPLVVGPNTISTVVTAQDGATIKTYTVTVTRAGSGNANLNALGPSVTPLTPGFSPATTGYTLSVSNATASMTVKPATSDANATIKVNGTALTSGTVSQPIALAAGTQTTISIVVTAQNGSTAKTYTITATRAPSPDASLSNLQLNSGTLKPAFAAGTTSYTTSVPNSTSTITLTASSTEANATIGINDAVVASGTASAAIALNVGSNTITTVVTAPDGITTKTYTVTVTRVPSANDNLASIGSSVTPLSPTFTPATTSYTLSVSSATASMTVKPVTSEPNATITLNGTATPSGTASGPIALAPGAQTVISVVVTAQDGTTKKTYTITVTRPQSADPSLSNLQLSAGTLSPTFATATTSYTASVPNSTASITVTPTTTDANATVKVNGTAVTSGTASGAILLSVGQNTITTIVTAQNGTTTKTYTATVTRVASANANLASIGSSVTPLSPAFAPATTSYAISVANTVATMTVKPVTSDANATIKVNGTALVSGTISPPIALAVGANIISVTVTAPDGTTTKTYTITVTRAAGGADSYVPGISVTRPAETPAIVDDGIVVHQAISPNGDGINDFLQIDNISQYPENKLTIMNRNGQLVYEAKGYDNSSKTFDGHSNKNGQMQLPGTYFYSLDYTVNGIAKHKTGFIVLKY